MSARERLTKFLCEMIHEIEPLTEKKTITYDKPVKLNIPLKFKEIAQMIAVTPEHLSRLLTEMEQQGIIKRDKGHLVINNPLRSCRI